MTIRNELIDELLAGQDPASVMRQDGLKWANRLPNDIRPARSYRFPWVFRICPLLGCRTGRSPATISNSGAKFWERPKGPKHAEDEAAPKNFVDVFIRLTEMLFCRHQVWRKPEIIRQDLPIPHSPLDLTITSQEYAHGSL